MVQSFRDGQTKKAVFNKGEIIEDASIQKTDEPNGTLTVFRADHEIFKNFRFRNEFIEQQLWNYAYLNSGLKISYNGSVYQSKNGLLDLLTRKTEQEEI